MRKLIQAVKDADDAWHGHDLDAAGRYWEARNHMEVMLGLDLDDDSIAATLAAIDAEVRQTQRGMIAALYWRAGVYACGSAVAGESGRIERCRALAERADALRCTADALEFPL